MIVLDVEASGLGERSYPIEIAWQDSTNKNSYDTFLIRPDKTWNYWDEIAESSVHNISRIELSIEGITISEASRRLNAALAGKTVYSDASRLDQKWILTLFRLTTRNPTFEIRSIYELLPSVEHLNIDDEFAYLKVTHRALADARMMIHLLEILS
jgi:hypothetical protein